MIGHWVSSAVCSFISLDGSSFLFRFCEQTIVTDLFGLQYLNLLSTMSLTVPIIIAANVILYLHML